MGKSLSFRAKAKLPLMNFPLLCHGSTSQPPSLNCRKEEYYPPRSSKQIKKDDTFFSFKVKHACGGTGGDFKRYKDLALKTWH